MRFSLGILLLLTTLCTGCGTPSFLITPVANTNRLKEVEAMPGKGWRPGKIAIIEVEGMLANVRSGGFLQPTENKVSLFVQELNTAANDPDVKAVVLRINSPGGTVTATDTMYEQVRRFREKTGKPVVASTQEIAASGGYYIACASDRIVVHPTSVVGSIGVIFNTFNLEGTLSKLGVRTEAIKSGQFKDMASPFKSITPEERQIMQGMIDEYFARFVTVVTSHRQFTSEENLRTATDGRVFSGAQAVELGLADQTGLLEDAIDVARQLAGAPNAKVVQYKRPYGYSGSIYADAPTPPPQTNVINVNLPDSRAFLPTGFYYLWEP